MPRGRKPDGEHALSNAERQARHRARRVTQPAADIARPRRSADRRSRPQRWRDAVVELLALQAEYAAWIEVLPDIHYFAWALSRAGIYGKVRRQSDDNQGGSQQLRAFAISMNNRRKFFGGSLWSDPLWCWSRGQDETDRHEVGTCSWDVCPCLGERKSTLDTPHLVEPSGLGKAAR